MDPTGIDALFSAVNVSGVSGNVQTLLVAGIGITLLFAGYKLVKRGIAALAGR